MDTTAKELRTLTLELFREEIISVIITYMVIAAILFWLVNHYDFYPEVGNNLIIALFVGSLCIKAYQVYKINYFRSAMINLSYSFKALTNDPVLSKKEEFNHYKKIFKALDYVFMDPKINVVEGLPKNYKSLCYDISVKLPNLNEEIKWFFVEKVSRLKYSVPINVIISSIVDKVRLEDLLKIKELHLNQRKGELLVEEIVDLILLLDSSTNPNKEDLELEIFKTYKEEMPDFLNLMNLNEKMDKRILNKLSLETNLLPTYKDIKKVVKI